MNEVFGGIMKVLVTGSAGHLGEALARRLKELRHDVVGLDILASPFTDMVGSIANPACVRQCMAGVDTVMHAATLHKPHVATHDKRDFIETNVTGTLTLLEEAAAVGVRSFVFTSTTSAFGNTLRPPAGEPAAWVTEEVRPVPRNIYGVSKSAAEELCHLFHNREGLACLVLRTSRFFPEEDDDPQTRRNYEDGNAKANEFLFRRADLEDIVTAHLLAAERAPEIGFGRYIISATTPFRREDLAELRNDAPAALARRVPAYAAVYERLGWRMFPGIDRVYVNEKARNDLGWKPAYDFEHVLNRLAAGHDPRSPLACVVGSKGYHGEIFPEGPYPVE